MQSVIKSTLFSTIIISIQAPQSRIILSVVVFCSLTSCHGKNCVLWVIQLSQSASYKEAEGFLFHLESNTSNRRSFWLYESSGLRSLLFDCVRQFVEITRQFVMALWFYGKPKKLKKESLSITLWLKICINLQLN